MVNSLSSGQGDRALHGRLRYADSRDESRAAGFAELNDGQHNGRGLDGRGRLLTWTQHRLYSKGPLKAL